MEGQGVLPSQWIADAASRGIIEAADALAPGQIQPNSLDLRLDRVAYRVQCSYLPGPEGMARKLDRFKWYEVPLEPSGTMLERNQIYLFPLQERLDLPAHIAARANPKSTTGRLDVFSRLVTEHGTAFDEVPAGYRGPLYLEVVPRSFAIRVRRGDCLAQIRFQIGDPRLGDAETAALLDRQPIVLDDRARPLGSRHLRIHHGIFLSVRMQGRRGEVMGYRSRKNTLPLDIRARRADTCHYWETIQFREHEAVILEPDEFYIFSSSELIRLPPEICAEMIPYDAGSGELRTHYAGFFDSGFGYAADLEPAASAAAVVLEIRNRDVPFLLEAHQPLFRLLLLRNTEAPALLYGEEAASHYQGQRLRLSKQFGS